ncbi:MAG: hypothetical protein GX417_00240 [Clostridiales bacterium]|nr:hypothetical protein [Clostridiales bacterium]
MELLENVPNTENEYTPTFYGDTLAMKDRISVIYLDMHIPEVQDIMSEDLLLRVDGKVVFMLARS